MEPMEFEDHPLADFFPLMTEEEIRELADDIRDNGLKEHIWIYEGKILDGRNRYRACRLVDAEVRIKEYSGPNPLAFVISKNLYRRHLTTGQRSMVADRIATARQGERRDLAPSRISGKVTQTEAAELVKVSVDSVADAGKVRRNGDPELVKAVESGEVPVSTAAKIAKLPKATQQAVVKAGPKAIKEAARKQTKAAKRNGKHKPEPTKNREPDKFTERPAKPVPGDFWPAAAALTAGTKLWPKVTVLPTGTEAVYDAYDQPVPAGTGDFFNDTTIKALHDEADAISARLQDFFTELDRAKSSAKAYPWTDQSAVTTTREKLTAAFEDLRTLLGDSLPYVLCPDCHGRPLEGRTGCASCRSTGYWPKSMCDENPARMPKPGRPTAGAR